MRGIVKFLYSPQGLECTFPSWYKLISRPTRPIQICFRGVESLILSSSAKLSACWKKSEGGPFLELPDWPPTFNPYLLGWRAPPRQPSFVAQHVGAMGREIDDYMLLSNPLYVHNTKHVGTVSLPWTCLCTSVPYVSQCLSNILGRKYHGEGSEEHWPKV